MGAFSGEIGSFLACFSFVTLFSLELWFISYHMGGNDSAQLAGERGVGSKGMNGVIYRDVTVMGVSDMFSVTIVGA